MRPLTLDYRRPSTRTERPPRSRWVIALEIGAGVCIGVAGLFILWGPGPYRPGTYRSTGAATDIHNIGTALEAFKIETGRYPTASEGLQALMTQPGNAGNWNGPYLKRLPLDPWGNPYVYHPPKGNPSRFVVLSVGPDGKEGTADDVR